MKSFHGVILFGAAVVVSIFAGKILAQTVGYCQGAANSANLTCQNVSSCGPIDCQLNNDTCPDGSCNPFPCQAYLVADNRKRGSCQEGNGNCFYCQIYYCGMRQIYQSRDINKQCQTKRCERIEGFLNSCLP